MRLPSLEKEEKHHPETISEDSDSIKSVEDDGANEEVVNRLSKLSTSPQNVRHGS